MIVDLITAPTREPVSVAKMKEHLRITIEDDDFLLQDYITTARKYVEDLIGCALLTQTWKYYMNCWPNGDWFELPFPPLQSVTSVKYKDSNETEYTFSANDYLVDIVSEPGRVVLKYGETWPSETLSPRTPIYTEYECGYGDSPNDVPMNLRHAIIMLVGHYYEHREAFISGQFGGQIQEVPSGLNAIMEQYRLTRFGI